MKRFRVHADTFVFGGCFDEEFGGESRAFFEMIKAGRFTLVISPTVLGELQRAPERVRRVLTELPPEAVEMTDVGIEVERLRDAYLDAGILGPGHQADAEHIACASVTDADFVVSWNFRHIVHFEKIAEYQAVNLLHGYREIRFYSPKEVMASEE